MGADHHRHFFSVLTIACSLVVVLVVFLLWQPQPIGRVIVAQGGYVTQLDISLDGDSYPLRWVGVYGNVTSGVLDNTVELVADNVVPLTLRYGGAQSDSLLVFASPSGGVNWDNLSVASVSDIDAFMGVSASDPVSASSTLSLWRDFVIGGDTYTLPSVQTLSVNGSFITGFLFSNGEPLMVSALESSSLGFDGSFADFQMMLPVSGFSLTNYSFFVYGENETPTYFSCNDSLDFVARVAQDNVSVNLSWMVPVGASGFELLYLDGAQGGKLDFSKATVVNLGLVSSWVDSSPGYERYYRLRSQLSDGWCLSQERVGTIASDLSDDYNLFSTPFTFVNDSVEEVLRPIWDEFSIINRFNNSAKSYDFFTLIGNSVFKTFDVVQPGAGYWVRVTGDTTLRLAGTLVEGIVEPVSPDYNLVGFPVIDNLDVNDSVSYVLSSIAGSYSLVNEFNNTEKSYEFYFIIGNSVFKTFDQVRPGTGYWIRVTNNDTINYTNNGG